MDSLEYNTSLMQSHAVMNYSYIDIFTLDSCKKTKSLDPVFTGNCCSVYCSHS